MLMHYWMHAFTLVFGLVVLTAVLIPVLSYLGLDMLAKPLFSALHAICAQIPSHSFYLFGHQLGFCQRPRMGINNPTFNPKLRTVAQAAATMP